jgi:hypothetical protein
MHPRSSGCAKHGFVQQAVITPPNRSFGQDVAILHCESLTHAQSEIMFTVIVQIFPF